jgi:hypothetical protein
MGVAGGALQITTLLESRQALLYIRGLPPLFSRGAAFRLRRFL